MLYPVLAFTQQLPDEYYITPDGRMLLIGSQPNTGLYDQSQIRTIRLTFNQPNYWNLLLQNYANKIDLPATMEVDGIIYDSVGVRLKGQTSFTQVNGQKKSFNISTDYIFSNQDIMGYKTLNLNNCYGDESFMREVLYQHQIKKHIPAAKSAFTKLYINGSNWGLYPHIQQLNKDFLEEWYLSNDGSHWRADRAPGTVGPPGWGDGLGALNDLGPDPADYDDHYQLKSSSKPNPYDDLVILCDKLNNTSPAALRDTMEKYMDLDKTLWHLATEIAWTDDDSYIHKGRMDYYVHYELETGRMAPHEYDGNSVMNPGFVNSWSPFYNANDVDYPLLNRLLAVPEIRQRYLAHMRTIIADELDTADCNAVMNNYKAMIDTIVLNDPKKLYSYNSFNTEINLLKSFVINRRNYLLNNPEVAAVPPVISSAAYYVAGVQYQQPASMQNVTVRTSVSSGSGIDAVYLYHSSALVGKFSRMQMYDDGAHDDDAPNDGIYGAVLPGYPAGTWVRYYVEAVSANASKTVAYLPAGAEHNVFIYVVTPFASSQSDIVINEVMASNSTTAADNDGEFDDWIELYNKGNSAVDISGFYLTDNPVNLDKWEIPAGTILQPDAYLIVWADEDSSQGPYHANFKLSGSGENLMLLDPSLLIVDSVSWGLQTTDLGYARMPNGTGPFVMQLPTFGVNNNLTSLDDIAEPAPLLSLYPNPVEGNLYIAVKDVKRQDIEVKNILGQEILKVPYSENLILDTSTWKDGMYLVQCGSAVKRVIVK